MAMRSKVVLAIVVVLFCTTVTGTATCALDMDRLLQVLAWSANTSDYDMSIDIIRRPHTGLYGGLGYVIAEGNPMFAGDPEYFRDVLDLKNAIIEVMPEVLPQPWSTIALLAMILNSGQAVVNNNRVFATVGLPTQFTLAYRYRW